MAAVGSFSQRMAIEAPVKRPELARLESLGLLRRVRVEYVVLLGLILVGAAIRGYFDFGLVKVDPFTYADAAGSIAHGERVYDSEVTGSVYYTQYIRLSLILPAALFYKLFGVSDFASTVWPVALSLGMAVLAYIAGRMISGRTAGLIAAAAVCLFPLNVINSTQFLPDIVLAAFSSLAMVCLLAATELPDTTRRQRFWLYVVTGAAIALACYARFTAVSLLPGIALILVARRRVGFDVLGLAAGGLGVFALAQVFLLSYGASLFEDVRVLRAESESVLNLQFDYARIFLTDRMFWPFFYAAGAGLGLFVWRRGFQALYRSPVFPLMVLIAFQYVYLEFLMSLPGVVTWWKEPRYALPIVFPVLVIGAAGWAEALGPALAGRRPLAAALAAGGGGLLLLAAIPPIADEYDFYINEDGNRVDFDQLAIAKVIPADATVYVHDDDFARPLSYRLSLAGTLYERAVSDDGRLHQRVDAEGRSKVTPGSYVVTLPRESWWALPTAPSPDWELVWEGKSGVTVHRVPLTGPGAGAANEPASRTEAEPPVVVQAEDWSSVAGAWQTITQGYLSLGAGRLAAPGSAATVTVPELPAGDYWVEFLVFNYVKGVNELSIELNGVHGTVSWGGEDGALVGVTRARAFLRDVPAGGELRVEVAGVGQEALIVDAVALSDRQPPE